MIVGVLQCRGSFRHEKVSYRGIGFGFSSSMIYSDNEVSQIIDTSTFCPILCFAMLDHYLYP